MEELSGLKEALQRNALPTVKELWIPQTLPQRWRKWKTTHQELGIPETVNL